MAKRSLGHKDLDDVDQQHKSCKAIAVSDTTESRSSNSQRKVLEVDNVRRSLSVLPYRMICLKRRAAVVLLAGLTCGEVKPRPGVPAVYASVSRIANVLEILDSAWW